MREHWTSALDVQAQNLCSTQLDTFMLVCSNMRTHTYKQIQTSNGLHQLATTYMHVSMPCGLYIRTSKPSHECNTGSFTEVKTRNGQWNAVVSAQRLPLCSQHVGAAILVSEVAKCAASRTEHVIGSYNLSCRSLAALPTSCGASHSLLSESRTWSTLNGRAAVSMCILVPI